MQWNVQRYLNRIAAVQAWLGEHEGELSSVARAGALRTQLGEQAAQIEAMALKQQQEGGDSTQSVVQKSALIDAINDDLLDIARTARVMDASDPGVSARFTLPASRGEQAIVAAARLFAANAEPMKAEFLSYGMPANFLDDLAADLSAYDTQASAKEGSTQGRMAARQQLEAALDASSLTVDALDAIVRNVFRASKIALDEWSRAKRLEQSRAHRETPEAKAARAAKA